MDNRTRDFGALAVHNFWDIIGITREIFAVWCGLRGRYFISLSKDRDSFHNHDNWSYLGKSGVRQYLLAPSFFWEDVVSMLVMALHTAYVVMWLVGWGTPTEQMWVALAAYASYVVNALQFLLKFQAAKQTSAADLGASPTVMGAQGALES